MRDDSRPGYLLPGVDIGDAVTRPCKVIRMGDRSFRIVLTQGLNRQIRRMCETLGYHVRTLKRIRIMNIRLGNLERGSYREIAGEEYDELMRLLDAQPDTEHETGNPDIYERAERRSNAMTAGRYDSSRGKKNGDTGFADGSHGNSRSTGWNGRSDSRNSDQTGESRSRDWTHRTGAAPRDEKTTAARFENKKLSEDSQKSRLNKSHKISIARRPKPETEE